MFVSIYNARLCSLLLTSSPTHANGIRHMNIKPSDIANSVKKVAKLNYDKYLRSMVITARAFTSEELRLDFPVTAVIGTNGGGKSTVLGAAALAYKSIKPRTFFPKSNVGDNSMSNWRIDFVILDRSVNSK